MKSIKSIKKLRGQTVLLRADFNVPLSGGKVTDPFRILKTLPTIEYLRSKGAQIVIVSHIGDDGSESLVTVARVLKKHFPLTFIPDVTGKKVTQALLSMKDGDVILLENLRKDGGEKANSTQFARELASYADVFVNDAFSVCHRTHASIVSVPKYVPSFAGFQLEREVRELSRAFKPKHPFLFILGGAKFSTKLPLIKHYLKTVDTLFIGGALANQVFFEQGYEVGESKVERENYNLKSITSNKKILLPADVMIASGAVKLPTEIKKGDNMLDIGPETVHLLKEKISNAKFILWNGPLGKTSAGFVKATRELMTAIGKSSAVSILGGGDTTEIISKYKLEKCFTFVSTGGGATIEFLAKGKLPGITALDKSLH